MIHHGLFYDTLVHLDVPSLIHPPACAFPNAMRLERVVLRRDLFHEIVPQNWHLLHDVYANAWYFGEEKEGEDACNTSESACCGAKLNRSTDSDAVEVWGGFVVRAIGRLVGLVV